MTTAYELFQPFIPAEKPVILYRNGVWNCCQEGYVRGYPFIVHAIGESPKDAYDECVKRAKNHHDYTLRIHP